MEHRVSITFGGIAASHYISGLPKSLSELVTCQRLAAPLDGLITDF